MYFPLFLDLSQKEILVVGAGTIARRRIRSLIGFAGHITVVALRIPPDFSAEMAEGDSLTQLTVIERAFEDPDLQGKDLVLAASDDAELNRHISELCRDSGILVNICTGSQYCDFQFPSVVETGAMVIGINASGKDHRLVKETRRQIEYLFAGDDFRSKYE